MSRIKVTIYIDEPVWHAAQAAARHCAVDEKQAVSASDILRRAIAHYLAKWHPNIKTTSPQTSGKSE